MNRTSATTDEDGRAQIWWVLGSGLFQELAVSPADPEYEGATLFVEATTDRWVHISILSGNGQTGVQGQPLPSPVVLYVFIQSLTQFATSTADAKWISGLEFRDGVRRTLAHDGRILETEHFLVFGDGSSDVVKVQYGDMAEESLDELLEAFDIPSAEELGIFPDRPDTKITIFSAHAQAITQHAFKPGFVLYAIDHPVRQHPLELPGSGMKFRNTVKHELMHVVDIYLLDGIGISRASLTSPPRTRCA